MTKRILVVDDEKDFCFFLKKNLEAAGSFDVTVCHDGSTALTLAESLKPDLILLDVLMPGMDGPEVARRLKENELTQRIPVVFLTAVVREEEAKDRESIGGWRYIAKPVKIKELVELINTFTLLK